MFKYSFKILEKVWDLISEIWDELPVTSPGKKIEKFHKSEEKFILNFIKKHNKNPLVLDLGCGTGRVLSILHKNNFNKLCGIDISSKMINKSKNKLPNAVLLQHDFRERLPFTSNLFEFILITGNTLTSGVEIPEVVLKNTYRVLKKNGFLIIACYNAEFMTKKFVRAYYEKLPSFLKYKKFDEKTKTVYFSNIFSHWVTKEELKKLLKDSGFRDVKIRKRGIGLIGISKK